MSTKRWHQSDGTTTYMPALPFDPVVEYAAIQQKVLQIDPVKYARSRNFLNGAVTMLSPYISRGVISTRQIYESLSARGYALHQMEKLVSELAWRDFFQRIWQARGNDILDDLKQQQPDVCHYRLPLALTEADTGIEAVDRHIHVLFEKGYMHNHMRMYTASIACNIAGAHWKKPAEWMYYHLLDGDIASNHLSWQWVAAAFSGKKYYANQENINKYAGSNQVGTFLDVGYDAFPLQKIPETLQPATDGNFTTNLPATPLPVINPALPLLIYNAYNLDPQWRKTENANRILLLEPAHYEQYPVSSKVIEFVTALAKTNISGIQVFSGAVNQIPHLNQVPFIASKEHPAFRHYPGLKDSRDWLVPEVTGYFPSFFQYWKKIERLLR